MLDHEAERKCILFLYKKHPDVPTPHYATLGSTCFDLTFFPTQDFVTGYDCYNQECIRAIEPDGDGLHIYPGDRLLVPTGLIAKLNVPNPRLSIRLHPRSGLALKRGLVLANAEGVIDADYQQEIFAILHNVSEKLEYLEVGTRICQGEIVKNRRADFRIIDSPPVPYTTRDGGFGSTGV